MRDDDLAPLCRLTEPAGRRMLQAFYFATVKAVLSMGLLVAAVLFAVGPASAHGRLGAAETRCRLFIGPDMMNFTGYMPDADKNEFCEDIPATGRMIMALDDIQDELRDMQVEIRIVKDVGGEDRENENLDAVTVAYSEPRYYRSGTINFQHNFPEAGYFRRHRHRDRRSWRAMGFPLSVLGRRKLHARATGLPVARLSAS